MNVSTKYTYISVDDASSVKGAGELSCQTGTINQEIVSGKVHFDDTAEKVCSFGQSECFKQTVELVMNGWPGLFLQYTNVIQ